MTWPCKNKDYLSICQRQEAEMYLEDALQSRLDEMNADEFSTQWPKCSYWGLQKTVQLRQHIRRSPKEWKLGNYWIPKPHSASPVNTCLETVLATLNPAICTNWIFQRAIITLIILSEEPFQKETNLCIPYPGFHAVWWEKGLEKAIRSSSKVHTLQDIEGPVYKGFQQGN